MFLNGLCALLALTFISNVSTTVDNITLAENILSTITRNEAMSPFAVHLFVPYEDIAFVPTWKLGSPYMQAAYVGFPSENDQTNQLNPFYDTRSYLTMKTENRTLKVANKYDFSLLQLVTDIVELKVSDIDLVALNWNDCQEMDSMSPSERVRYIEANRPRYFWPLFIDIYRSLVWRADYCTTDEGEDMICPNFFINFPHVIWMYSWLICRYLGDSIELDVDGICPKLCRPHPKAFVTLSYQTANYPNFLYDIPIDYNAVDVCGQVKFAEPGSCILRRSKVSISDFRCRCISSAYVWTVVDGQLGCFLRETVFQNLITNDSFKWRVDCDSKQISMYCKGAIKACYYRLQPISVTSEPLSKIDRVTAVLQSPWPHCICEDNRGGISCTEHHGTCYRDIPGAINNSSNYARAHISDTISHPLHVKDQDSWASGNYLCGVTVGRGSCIPSETSPGGFECSCALNRRRDYEYSKYDNCFSVAPPKKLIMIEGRPAITCGSLICLNGGQCVDKLLYGKAETNKGADTEEYVPHEVCLCQPGYVGDSCDILENQWAPWAGWTACYPDCGGLRYKYRVRECDGDAACIGSAMESAPCPNTECPQLFGAPYSEPLTPMEILRGKGGYDAVSDAAILFWMLGLMIPCEVILILVGLLILEKCILRSVRDRGQDERI